MTQKKPGAKMGRPTSLTPQVHKKIVEEVRGNLSITNASKLARVHPESIRNWMEQGWTDTKSKVDTVFAHFFVDVREAQAHKVRDMMQKIEAGQKNWQGIAWLLEKCCADEFGKDSEMYKQLLEDYKKLIQDMVERNKQTLTRTVSNDQTQCSKAQETPQK